MPLSSQELVLLKQRIGRELNPSEIELIQELADKDYLTPEVFDVEPEPSPEDRVLDEVRSQSDCEEIQIRPKEDNPFNNISQIIVKSRILGKQVIMDFSYTDIMRDGRLVGREGGITKTTILELSKEVLK